MEAAKESPIVDGLVISHLKMPYQDLVLSDWLKWTLPHATNSIQFNKTSKGTMHETSGSALVDDEAFVIIHSIVPYEPRKRAREPRCRQCAGGGAEQGGEVAMDSDRTQPKIQSACRIGVKNRWWGEGY